MSQQNSYQVLFLMMWARLLKNVYKTIFLRNCWRPKTSNSLHEKYFGSKKLSFQLKWLDERPWLAYSAKEGCEGGWRLFCVLFLNDEEKRSVGNFVNSPFTYYKNSKERLDRHEAKEFHKKSMERADCIIAQVANIEHRIDTQISKIATLTVKINRAVLPLIVDAVLLCAKQQITPRGHRDDKLQFDELVNASEGNFITIIRLLAESNPDLKEHLI